MSNFTLTYLHTNPMVGGYARERKYQVIHNIHGPMCVLSVSLGACCAFNMMEQVSGYLWKPNYRVNGLHEELKEFLSIFTKSRGDDAWEDTGIPYKNRPLFRVNQFFWAQNSDLPVQPEFVKQFVWQSASEPGHTTTMYQYSFGEQ